MASYTFYFDVSGQIGRATGDLFTVGGVALETAQVGNIRVLVSEFARKWALTDTDTAQGLEKIIRSNALASAALQVPMGSQE